MEKIEIQDGWIVKYEGDLKGDYSIKGVVVRFGHGIYWPIDTSEFKDAQWDVLHTAIRVKR